MHRRPFIALCLLALSRPLVAQQPVPDHKAIKWIRDSQEYVVLIRQVFRQAADVVREAARRQPRGLAWAVVLDLDETVMDNSVYQLERAAYALPVHAHVEALPRRRAGGVRERAPPALPGTFPRGQCDGLRWTRDALYR